MVTHVPPYGAAPHLQYLKPSPENDYLHYRPPLEILFDIIKSLGPSSALSNLALCSRRLYYFVVPFSLSIDANEAPFPLRKLTYLFLRRPDLAQNKFSKESLRKAFIESTVVCCSSISSLANSDVKAKEVFNSSKIDRE